MYYRQFCYPQLQIFLDPPLPMANITSVYKIHLVVKAEMGKLLLHKLLIIQCNLASTSTEPESGLPENHVCQ